MAASVMLVLVGCAATDGAGPPQPTSAAPPSATATVEPAPDLTAADIAAWAADAEWSYAPDGLGVPHTVALTGGVGTDDLGRPYSLGEAIGADLDGDGVMDAAIPITMVDGNAVHELWYIWRGLGADSEPVAEQVIYPISRTTRCGDVTRAVTPLDGALQLDVVLWMPHTDAARSCAEGGSGVLTRVISLSEIDGQFYPVQTAPVTAWGGVCPPTEWLDGSPEMGLAARVAPAPSAPAAIDPARAAAVFGLREAPLLTAGGGSFFGFIQDYGAADPVRMHCAFGV
ncbi:hypothetical protein [Microbacterium aurum]